MFASELESKVGVFFSALEKDEATENRGQRVKEWFIHFFINFASRVKQVIIGTQAHNHPHSAKTICFSYNTHINHFYCFSHTTQHNISRIPTLFNTFPYHSQNKQASLPLVYKSTFPINNPLLLNRFLPSYKIMIPNPETNDNPLLQTQIQPHLHHNCVKCWKEHSTTPNSTEDEPTDSQVPYKSAHTSCHFSQSSNREEGVSLSLNSLKQQLSCTNQADLLKLCKDTQLLNISHSTKVSLKLILTHKLADLNPKYQKTLNLVLEEYQSFHFSLI